MVGGVVGGELLGWDLFGRVGVGRGLWVHGNRMVKYV